MSVSKLESAVCTTKNRVLNSASLTALVAVLAVAIPATSKAQTVAAPTPQTPQGVPTEPPAEITNEESGDSEITVTGTRIVRDGYSSPTPLTVVGEEQIQAAARPNVADFVNMLPSLAGSSNPQNSNASVSAGGAGMNALNLRNLGTVRTLVLLDGVRSVGSQPTGIVDVNDFPQQLVTRIDIVTGGASAAYGSDALSGVVNFVLDRKFTGLKGVVSGGVTTYGDDANYRAALSGGTPFADGRGHAILSGEISYIEGVDRTTRDWNRLGWHIMNNPNYTATNGQPERLVLPQLAQSNLTMGGIITAGPLRGTAFGPGGTPYQFNYGPLVADPWMQGGDWQANDVSHLSSLDAEMARKNIFARLSYEFSEALELFVQGSYSHSRVQNITTPQFNQGNLTVSADNPFLPASVAAQARDLGLTTLRMGTFSGDLPLVSTDNTRQVRRIVIGGSGRFGLLGSDWRWDVYYQDGRSEVEKRFTDRINANFARALDTLRDPATGMIVCRSTLIAPNNGCVPYNPFGTGVNSAAAVGYVTGESVTDVYFTQRVAAATLRGEPFSIWAGPVSLALGAEHRREGGGGSADPISAANGFFVGNQAPTFGSYHVTEGFVETVVPLAKDLPFAQALDLNAAVRLTDYSTSGLVTTWKVGATWSPLTDLTFRATRSRDIRAPNRQELFAAGVFTSNTLIDPFRNNAGTTYTSVTIGNINLQPEKADTLGAGVVYRPSWFPGFSASVDYYDIKIKDAIGSLAPQAIVDRCFAGNELFCEAITRDNNVITKLLIQPFNFLNQRARGIDIEASYRVPLENLFEGSDGNLTVRGLATRYLENSNNNGVNIPTDTVASNTGSGPPKWRYVVTATYDSERVSLNLTGRGLSAGVYDTSFIECASGCPTSTSDNRTINTNRIAGAFYVDLALSYKFPNGANENRGAELFTTVTNLLDRDPPVVAMGPGGIAFATPPYNPTYYDGLGRRFQFGVRFRY
jgi:iron complex outermembrane receptor protein